MLHPIIIPWAIIMPMLLTVTKKKCITIDFLSSFVCITIASKSWRTFSTKLFLLLPDCRKIHHSSHDRFGMSLWNTPKYHHTMPTVTTPYWWVIGLVSFLGSMMHCKHQCMLFLHSTTLYAKNNIWPKYNNTPPWLNWANYLSIICLASWMGYWWEDDLKCIYCGDDSDTMVNYVLPLDQME